MARFDGALVRRTTGFRHYPPHRFHHRPPYKRLCDSVVCCTIRYHFSYLRVDLTSAMPSRTREHPESGPTPTHQLEFDNFHYSTATTGEESQASSSSSSESESMPAVKLSPALKALVHQGTYSPPSGPSAESLNRIFRETLGELNGIVKASEPSSLRSWLVIAVR